MPTVGYSINEIRMLIAEKEGVDWWRVEANVLLKKSIKNPPKEYSDIKMQDNDHSAFIFERPNKDV